MTTINKKGFSIVFETTTPKEDLQRIAKALAGAFRWRSCISNDDVQYSDNESLYTLANLLEKTSQTVEKL